MVSKVMDVEKLVMREKDIIDELKSIRLNCVLIVSIKLEENLQMFIQCKDINYERLLCFCGAQ